MERERIDVDIVIVGAGPAGLAAAVRLGMQLEAMECEESSRPTILVIEKGFEVGSHVRSGAIIDPKAFQELWPEFESVAPVEQPVCHEAMYFLTRKRAIKIPSWLLPGELKNNGNLIVSLSKLTRWMAKEAEKRGIMILTETSVLGPILADGRVIGVYTGPKGRDKQGNPKGNYDPGADIYANLVILAEGALGTVTEQVIEHFNLRDERQPMLYSSAVKEVIELPEKRHPAGTVLTTMGWPQPKGAFGGAFFYDMAGPYVAVGLVYGTDWEDPEVDLHLELQRWKTHPLLADLLAHGRVVQFGGCIIPESGLWAIPRLYASGVLLTGDSAGFVNVPRNKGIHLAVKSGILAADTALECWKAQSWDESYLKHFETRVRESWIWKELWKVRNYRQAFQGGMVSGILRVGMYSVTGGRLLRDPLPIQPGHRLMPHGSLEPPDPVPFDNQLRLDKPSAVARGAPSYDEQPSHIAIPDPELCLQCQKLYDSPCTKFCPAFVYRWETEEQRIIISYENCLHPKICLVACPYDNIQWIPPQGGDGPRFTLM